MKYESELPIVARSEAMRLLPSAGPPDRFSNSAVLRGQIHRWFNALWRRWWALLLPLLLIGGVSVFIALRQPVTYKCEAIMWLTGKLNMPFESRYAEDLTSYISTQAELMRSGPIRARAWAKVCSTFPTRFKQDTPGDKLPFELTIRASAKNSVLELQATGPAPDATRVFLNAVMEEYRALKKGSHQEASSGALAGLTTQIKAAEEQVRQQQDALKAFAVSNNLSYLTENSSSAGSQLARLTGLLSDLRTEHRLLELLTPEEFKDLSRGTHNSGSESVLPGDRTARALALSSTGPNAAYYQALQQLQLLKAKRDGFAQALRPTHSKMIKLSQEILGLEQLLQTLRDEGAQQAFAQMVNRKKSLELQIENLESQYRTWETNATQASAKLGDYERMKQDLQRSQALYDRLVGLLQNVDLNKELDQEPLAPLGPASRGKPTLDRYKIAAAGIFLGLMAGLGLLFLLEVLDDRLTSVHEARLALPVEVVGQVPENRLRARNGRPPLLGTAKQPAFEEAFRNLRSSLLFVSAEEAAHPRVFLVTSAIPKEGKTTISVNFATALAMSGSRVLIIDADFRRSSVHNAFGIPVEPGLHEVLKEEVLPEDAIVATPQPNLFVLPAGDGDEASSDLFRTSRIRGLLHELGAKFEYIIIDTAPVLATDEAASLGPLTDGIYLVVRNSYTSLRMIREATSRLELCKVKLLGIVYNRAAGSTDYYSRYSREYGTQPRNRRRLAGAGK